MRTSRRGWLVRLGGFSALALAGAAAPALAAEQQNVVDEARIVVERFLSDPTYAPMRVYVQNAYGVLVVPDLLKGGFIIGGQYGVGVFLARDPQTGLWSEPAFFSIYGGSLGLQIGGQKSDVLFTLMNPAAIDRLLTSRFKIGADAGGALGPVGSGIGAGTTVHFGEDLYVFSRNMGLYGGLSLDGTVIAPKDDWNTAYYGQRLTAAQIVKQKVVSNQQGSAELRNVLARF